MANRTGKLGILLAISMATLSFAGAANALASPHLTLYFHATVPVGNVDNAITGGASMDSNAPTDLQPAVAHGTVLVDGTNTETLWDASWQSTTPVTLSGDRVTFVWWVASANQGVVPSDWTVEIWQRFSLTSFSKIASASVSFATTAGDAPVEFQATLSDVSTASYGTPTVFSSIVALIDADTEGEAAHAILYDSTLFPSRLEVREPNQAPTADIDAPSCAKKDHDVTFDGSGSTDSDGTIVSYSWDFGDGATASGAVATHAYSFDGASQDFIVTLTVEDDEGATGQTTHSITIGPPPFC